MLRNAFVAIVALTGCGQVDESRHLHFDAASACSDQTACKAGDDCCPPTCNANNDSDCTPKCGNNIVEMGETCDGNCPTCTAETLTCFTQQTGSAATCDVKCHIPQQTCAAGDMCCPFVMGQDGNACSIATDSDCAGTAWKYTEVDWGDHAWPAGGSVTTAIYGMEPGDSVLLTTCTPDDVTNSSDTLIVRVVDNNNTTLATAADDTTDPGALPRLAGWNCTSTANGGFPMSTAPQNPGGFRMAPNTYRINVTLGGKNGAAGSAKLYIWWNGNSFPNPG